MVAQETLPLPDELVGMLRTMLLIRRFDETALTLRLDDRIYGVVHPYIGEEAIATGAISALAEGDFIVSHHRGHGHCIARGASVDRMMAELFGKANGYCGGKGGSMHIADFSRGIVGANGIVGAGIPIGAGVALAGQLLGHESIVLVFFGDGAVGQGVLYEALNYSALSSLPVIWLCENNAYAAESSAEDTLAMPDVAAIGLAYRIPSMVVDGSDVLAVRRACRSAAARARAGEGPSLLECKTYRFGVHSQRRVAVAERRPADYLSRARSRDPIALYAQALTELGVLSGDRLDALQREVEDALEQAIAFAEQAPAPEPTDAYVDIYADGSPEPVARGLA